MQRRDSMLQAGGSKIMQTAGQGAGIAGYRLGVPGCHEEIAGYWQELARYNGGDMYQGVDM
jgi:hypothetical protein